MSALMPRLRRRRREAAILALLDEHPGGLLTRFLAQKLGWPPVRVLRADLGRLVRAGHIEADEVRNWNPAVRSEWRWHLIANDTAEVD